MVELSSTQGRRTSDQRIQAASFCSPNTGGDIKLTLNRDVAAKLERIPVHRRVDTADLIAAAKLSCPPLRGSINSRYMAIAVLRGAR